MSLFFFFKEKDGSFSWRKTGTALCFILFAYSVIGYLHTHKFNELPNSYQAIITMVFTFYFFKEVINKINLSTSNKQKEENKLK